MLLISASLMLPAQAISQPLFAIFKTLGLYDTKFGLIIVYAAMGIPMSILRNGKLLQDYSSSA